MIAIKDKSVIFNKFIATLQYTLQLYIITQTENTTEKISTEYSKLFQVNKETIQEFINDVLYPGEREQQKQQELELETRTINNKQELETKESKSKELRETRLIIPPIQIPDWIPVDSWNDFVDSRKKLKKPLTQVAIKLAISSLSKLKSEGSDPKEVLEQSIPLKLSSSTVGVPIDLASIVDSFPKMLKLIEPRFIAASSLIPSFFDVR
jgi:tyrosyl-tRNA synthetase